MGFGSITILEREERIGFHASGRNAGLCRQLTESDETTAYTVRGARFLANPPSGFSAQPVLLHTGSLLIAQDESFLNRMVERAHRWEITCERLGGEDVIDKWPELSELKMTGALFVQNDGVINTDALLQAFLLSSERHGTMLKLSCAVHDISETDSGVLVRTSQGDFDADFVVNAAGAWVAEVGAFAGLTENEYTCEHRHIHVCKTERPDKERPYVWCLGEDEFYIRPHTDGLLMSGCDVRLSRPTNALVDDDEEMKIRAKLDRVAPSLRDTPFSQSWACLRTFSEGRVPKICWDSKREWLFWVAGLGGHGATGSYEIGRVAAEKIAAR